MKIKAIVATLIISMLSTNIYALKIEDFSPRASISLKRAGNKAVDHDLKFQVDGKHKYRLTSDRSLPLSITERCKSMNDDMLLIEVKLTAKEDLYFQFSQTVTVDKDSQNSQFYMPGFWYRRNLRSPEKAPSFHTSQDWSVREDRLSSPLVGSYNEASKRYTTILRQTELESTDALTTHSEGEVILSGKTSLGYLGFANSQERNVKLCFGFPYQESPKSYRRKLRLEPAIRAYQRLNKGESIEIKWYLKSGEADSFADFVTSTWDYCYDVIKPQPIAAKHSIEKMKRVLSSYFLNSYVDKYQLKYYSGVHLPIESCKSNGIAEIGFLGRTLLNGYNAMEYGVEKGRNDLTKQAEAVFDSYLNHGFTPNNFFRELAYFDRKVSPKKLSLSIRRQSEGVYAMLYYLQYERSRGVTHDAWEKRIATLLDNMLSLQTEDGHFPRKFTDEMTIIDSSGGSTSCAICPLVMAYRYFGERKYLDAAKLSAKYLEEKIISKADYFSSTLDANCEDKEAALYAATALYYLSLVTEGNERNRYTELCRKASQFALTWYYLWDVPFAQGQMLGDIGFKSRGWGNVSVENNHIDVYVFEFASILRWLAEEYRDHRYSQIAEMISNSMRQLLPCEGDLCGISEVGYHPEVVQHTWWDYGHNGKGFYNNDFAPGWVTASLWELLSPGRIESYFSKTK